MLSVGEELCETVEQVWVVPRQDRHQLSQAFPEGTHLKFFSLYLHSRKKQKKQNTKHALSHAETCQSTGSLFPAVEPTAIRNPPALLLQEFLFFPLHFCLLPVACLSFSANGSSSGVCGLLSHCLLLASCQSFCILPQKWHEKSLTAVLRLY